MLGNESKHSTKHENVEEEPRYQEKYAEAEKIHRDPCAKVEGVRKGALG